MHIHGYQAQWKSSSNGLVADIRLKEGHFLLEGFQIQLSQRGLKCSWELISPLKLRELDFQPHRRFDLLSMVVEENSLSNTPKVPLAKVSLFPLFIKSDVTGI